MARSNIGKDCSLRILYNGTITNIRDVTDFQAKAEYKTQRTDPLNGPPRETPIPSGWRISFGADRGSSALDVLFAQIESVFWTTGQIGSGTIYQTIQEVDGTTTTWEYSEVGLMYADAGNFTAETTVKQKVTGFSGRRVKV